MVNRTGYTGEDGCRAAVSWPRTRRRSGTRVLERGADAVRARRPRHAAARGLLPAARQRHQAGDRCDLRRARLGCALDKEFAGADDCAASRRTARARLVAFVMEEKAIPRQGMPIEGGGEVTSGSHSPMLDRGIGMGYVPAALPQPDTELAIDVRGKPRARARRQEADLQEGGVTSGGERELSRRPEVPPRARLGPHRRRRGGARHHVVRAGRARRARALRAARARATRSRRTQPTARWNR